MSTSARDAMSRGDLTAWVESMGPDEIEYIDVDLSPLGKLSGTFARFGRTLIGIGGSGHNILTVADTEAEATALFAEKADSVRADVETLEKARATGSPEVLIEALMAVMDRSRAPQEPVPVPASLPAVGRATVPVREVLASADDNTVPMPTGLYL